MRDLGFLFEEYVRGSPDVIGGTAHDPKFGSLVMFELGGIYVETMRDVVFRQRFSQLAKDMPRDCGD